MSRELYNPFKINLSFMRGMVFDTSDNTTDSTDTDDSDSTEKTIGEYASYKDAIDAEGVGAEVMINGNLVKAETADNYQGNNVWGDTSDTTAATTGDDDDKNGLDFLAEELNTGGDDIGATVTTNDLATDYYETGAGKDGATSAVDFKTTNSGDVFNPTAGDDDGDTLAEEAARAKAAADKAAADALKKFTTNEEGGVDDLASELFSEGVYNQELLAGEKAGTTDLSGLTLSGDELEKTVAYDNSSNDDNDVDMSTTSSGEELDETAGADDQSGLTILSDELAATQNGERSDGVDAVLIEKYGWTMGPDGDAIEPGTAVTDTGDELLTLDGVTYATQAEYDAAVKFKAEQGSYDEEPAFQYKGVTYATQAEYDAAVAADEAVTDTGFSEVFEGVTYTDEDAYYKAVQAAENGEDVFSKVFEGVTYTDEAAYNAAVLAAASDDDEGETYVDQETSELIFPFTYKGVTYNTQEELDAAFNNGDGFTYNGVTYATQAEYEAAVLAGANAADDSLTLDGVTYATQAEYDAAVAAANAAASNDGVDGGVVADTNQDGEITKLEAEIKDLREKLGLLTDTSTGETEGMTKDEIIAAINEAMENFNGNDYDPAAFMNAFGFAMNPTYFGNTIPTYMSENGVYTRRAVKDKDTGETRYVNVPIANQGGQVSQYRQNRRKGFGLNRNGFGSLV